MTRNRAARLRRYASERRLRADLEPEQRDLHLQIAAIFSADAARVEAEEQSRAQLRSQLGAA